MKLHDRFRAWFSDSNAPKDDHVQLSEDEADYPRLKQARVHAETDTEGPHVKSYTSAAEHFKFVRQDFIGRTELEFYHARLIVLIRREIELERNLDLFFTLWQREADFLCQNLSLRWLVSAADTFADYGQAPETRALALSASLLLNTVKLVETERIIQDTQQAADQPEKVAFLLDGAPVELFDGVTAYRAGRGDMIRNLYNRLQTVSAHNVAGMILRTVFDRLRLYDTLYARFAGRHRNRKTRWWD
jgi:hypothetical protein